jgi:DNA-binding response OmpR family regulator
MAKILLAYDDEDIRGMAMMILHGWGHEVIEAANGFDAVTLAGKEMPDLILLDYHMPEQDGFVALVLIRRQGLQMPVVMLTGETSQAFAIQCFRSGADDFLTKPFDPDYLPIMVDRALRHAKTREKVSAMSSEVFALLSVLRGLYGLVGRAETCPGCGRKGQDGHDEGCPVQHAGRVLDRLGGAPAAFGARPGGGV